MDIEILTLERNFGEDIEKAGDSTPSDGSAVGGVNPEAGCTFGISRVVQTGEMERAGTAVRNLYHGDMRVFAVRDSTYLNKYVFNHED